MDTKIAFVVEILEQREQNQIHFSLEFATHVHPCFVHTLELDRKSIFLVFFVHISESLEYLEMHLSIFLHLKIMHTRFHINLTTFEGVVQFL